MSRVSYDENGFLRGFPYHDGFLDGLLADDVSTDVHLTLRATSGERRVLTLRHVKALDVQGFREGNIILNLRVLPTARITSDAEILRMLADRLFLGPANLSADTMVFRLESSFGADILAICDDVEVSESGRRLTLSAP